MKSIKIGFLCIFCLLLVPNESSILSSEPKTLENHHDNKEVFDLIDQVNKKCPDITYVYDLGLKSVKGLPLRVIVFSDNPSEHEFLEPEFKYVGNMHGNEVVGREMMIELMVQLCDEYLDKNQNVIDLIHNTRIHLLITMNPDGWDEAVNSEFEQMKSKFKSVKDMLHDHGVADWFNGRENANGIDLNRNFPDLDKYEYKYAAENKARFDHLLEEATQEINVGHVDCQNKTFQPETLAVASWISRNPFVLSANFHGGDLVVNYPYDDSPDHATENSATPDDFTFRDLSKYFVHQHGQMSSPNKVKCDMLSGDFVDGITNGANWYPVCGGMQDYNYLASNCFEITIELGCKKFPPGKELKQYWQENVNAFYEYIWKSHMGIKGVVVNERDEPVAGAHVKVARLGRDNTFKLIKHHITTSKYLILKLIT